MRDHEDQRRVQRRDSILYLPVYPRLNTSEQASENEGSEPLARLVDISPEGMLLISRQALPQDTPLDAAVSLPRNEEHPPEEGTGTTLSCRLTPRWSKQDVNPRNILTGCSMEIPPGQEALVQQLLTYYSFNNDTKDFRQHYQERMDQEERRDQEQGEDISP